MAIAPPSLPYPANWPYLCYVPILDGVAAKLRLTNHPDTGEFLCGFPGDVVTKDFATTPRPLEVWAAGSTTWTSTCTEIQESVVGSAHFVHAVYSGASLPAMPNNVIPAGWNIGVHPWGVRDTEAVPPINTGFYPLGLTEQNRFAVYFVPYFQIVAASTTQSLTDGSDQYWYLYLAKPLNYNQVNQLVATATSSWGASLTVGYETNGFGQVTAVKVLVPLGTSHPTQTSNTLHLHITESLYYLKGEAFVTETITHLDQDFTVQITATPDTTAPTFSKAKVSLPSEAGTSASGMLWYNAPDADLGYRDTIGAKTQLKFEMADPGSNASGLDRLEVWIERGGTLNEKMYEAALNGQKTASITALVDLRSRTTTGAIQGTRFLAKLYDVAGQVTTRYMDPPTAGQTQYMWSISPNCNQIEFNGVYLGGAAWGSPNRIIATIVAPIFVQKVEFYVDNVLVGTKTTPDTTTTAGNLVSTYTCYHNFAAGTHVVKVLTYDKTSDSVANVHTMTQGVTTSVYMGGGSSSGVSDLIYRDGSTGEVYDQVNALYVDGQFMGYY